MTKKGGEMSTRPVIGYQSPQGPTEQMRREVGLGGDNCGKAGTQGAASPSPETSGSVGIGGTNHGCCGSQGRH
jgi:hypothetical protein